MFAYFGVVDLWRRLRRDRDPAVRRRARFEFAHWRVQTGDAYTLLCASSRLTAAGREFTAMMAESAAHWTGQESVPDDLALLAREAVIAHRLGWRAHYLRPSAGQIAELAEAWLSGAAGPPRRHVDTVFREVCPAPGLTEYGDRLRRAACDPGGISWSTLHPVDHARLSGETGTACRLAVDRLPREWEQPWPWIRSVSPCSDSPRRQPPRTATGWPPGRAITHRPEVVRALYAQVTEATGKAPDPVRLAARTGAPDHAGDSPPLPLTGTV
ncbi:HEXXH motif domain-containing protein [Streptomyces sp. DSM 40868]|nr:HEXXH motif domain-containing protein [Streptomyces sp. DSM 40868]